MNTSSKHPDENSSKPVDERKSQDQRRSDTELEEEPNEVDEASRESFPASDPPTFTGTTASRSKPK